MISKILGADSTTALVLQSSKKTLMGGTLAFVTLVRMSAPFWNIALFQRGGNYAVFLFSSVFYGLACIGLVLSLDALLPHYSYIILKQNEMVDKKIVGEKDMRLLETFENGRDCDSQNCGASDA